MTRFFTVKERMSREALQEALVDARFSGPQMEAAMAQLMAHNPHLDFKKLRVGTVIRVPDQPGFKASAGDAKATTPIAEFVALARNALSTAAQETKQAIAERASERAELVGAFKTPAFKRLMEEDKDLAFRVGETSKFLSAEEEIDRQDEQSLARLTKSASVTLDALAKLGEG